jgi:hypothetical protein
MIRMASWVVLAFFLAVSGIASAQTSCVFCATRSACFPTSGSGNESCYFDGNGCFGMGSCSGAKCKHPGTCFYDGGFGRSGWSDELARPHPQTFVAIELPATLTDGYALEADPSRLRDLMREAPRYAETLWNWIALSPLDVAFGKSGESVAGLEPPAEAEMMSAMAQRRVIRGAGDEAYLRYSKAIAWAGDASLLMILTLEESSAQAPHPDFLRQALARFERKGETLTPSGRRLPVFALTDVQVVPHEGRRAREPRGRIR